MRKVPCLVNRECIAYFHKTASGVCTNGAWTDKLEQFCVTSNPMRAGTASLGQLSQSVNGFFSLSPEKTVV